MMPSMKSIAHRVAGAVRIDLDLGRGASDLRGWEIATPRESMHVDAEGLREWLSRVASGLDRLVCESDEIEIPVVLGYDLMTDLMPIWADIAADYEIDPLARSPRDIYRLGLRRRGAAHKRPDFVFWDLRHMDPRGPHAIAEEEGEEHSPAGEARALLQHVERLRTESPEIDPDAIGGRIITSTGVAREMASARLGGLEYAAARGTRTLAQDYSRDAAKEFPRDFEHYAMRKACARGGFTFCAAANAMRVHGRTLSLDESSAHHAQALGRYVPEMFSDWSAERLDRAFSQVVARDVRDVLGSPRWPWPVAFNALVEFTGLRLRSGSVWEREGIGLVSMTRFSRTEAVEDDDDPSAVEAIRGIRAAGFADEVEDGVFAFGKLMEARRLRTWVTDIEAWCMSRVYDWDAAHVLRGEATGRRTRPDDLCILTSMSFYGDKMRAKAQLAASGGDEGLRESYVGRVKARFNAVGYGLHARDELRPSFSVDEQGEWHMQPAVSAEDFDERRPRRPRAWFTYGTRIAGWSRAQLVIAVELVGDALRGRGHILAGDTDSIKVSTDAAEGEVLSALEPLHASTRSMIRLTTSRARELFPEHVSDMRGCGEFEVESDGRYVAYYPAWSKAGAGLREDGSVDLTLAGVPRQGSWSLAAWLRLMVDAHGFAEVLPRVLAFDCILSPTVSQVMQVEFDSRGVAYVSACPYTLASTREKEHADSLAWLREHGRGGVLADAQRYATWTAAGAAFGDSDGELEAPRHDYNPS